MTWMLAIDVIIFALETLLRPKVRQSSNPIDDTGLDAILTILNAWKLAKGGSQSY
ncbi:MAG: hypothetical protein ACKO34_03555 [Vampirovibrionales bacterium]